MTKELQRTETEVESSEIAKAVEGEDKPAVASAECSCGKYCQTGMMLHDEVFMCACLCGTCQGNRERTSRSILKLLQKMPIDAMNTGFPVEIKALNPTWRQMYGWLRRDNESAPVLANVNYEELELRAWASAVAPGICTSVNGDYMCTCPAGHEGMHSYVDGGMTVQWSEEE